MRLLDEELDIPVDEKIREELKDMCNLSEGIEEKGMKAIFSIWVMVLDLR